MTHAKRVDSNQTTIIKALRSIGCSVTLLYEVGNGCPDIVVGCGGKNFMIEIKTEDGELNEKEKDWFENWKGDAKVCRTIAEALRYIGAI